MKKLLTFLSLITIFSPAVSATIACNNGSVFANDEFITGIDVINYAGDKIVRNLQADITSTATTSVCTTTISKGHQANLAIVRFNKPMFLSWSSQDTNSSFFVTNDIIDYSTWFFLAPGADTYTEIAYQYLIIPLTQDTTNGEVVKAKDELKNDYSFVLKVNDLDKTEAINVDTSKISSDEIIDYQNNNASQQFTDILQLLMQAIISNALAKDNQDASIRILGQMLYCLANVEAYQQTIFGGLFTYYYSKNQADLDDLGKLTPLQPTTTLGSGTYYFRAEINQTLVDSSKLLKNMKTSTDNYTLSNYPTFIFHII